MEGRRVTVRDRDVTTEAEMRERERFKDAVLLTLKMEEGPQAKAFSQLLEAGKVKEMNTPL